MIYYGGNSTLFAVLTCLVVCQDELYKTDSKFKSSH